MKCLFLQSIEETNLQGTVSPSVQSLLSTSLDLVYQVSHCMTHTVSKQPDNYPSNLYTEWTEFFSESIFAIILPLYLKYYSKYIGVSSLANVKYTKVLLFKQLVTQWSPLTSWKDLCQGLLTFTRFLLNINILYILFL